MRRFASVGYTWMLVLGIYLRVGLRFWRWRIRLWLQQLHIMESTRSGMKQTLLFIRHGESTWNAERILPGQLPGIPLNDKGREQAARLAESLRDIPLSAIISSPLERASETAEIVAQGRGLSVQFDAELMDTNIGNWAGQKYDELPKIDPAWKAYVENPTVAPEGVETFPQVQQRSLAAVDRWRCKDGIGEYPAFVAHADVIKLLIAHYMNLDAGKAGSIFIENASVSIVEIDSENLHQTRVVAVGWSPRPGWLKPSISPKKDETPVPEIGEQKT
jgi:broad specificity phosphatase PhoE